MQQLDWTACLLHLCYFLNLISELQPHILETSLREKGKSRESAILTVLSNVSTQRMAELSRTPPALANWADLTHSMHHTAIDFEPRGFVEKMDVFYTKPLSVAARSKEEWAGVHLSKWRDFVRTEPVFHEVGGAHYTMLSPEHVAGFAATLRKVLEVRKV